MGRAAGEAPRMKNDLNYHVLRVKLGLVEWAVLTTVAASGADRHVLFYR